MITCSNAGGGFYTEPYDQQIAQNMMRDWGVPFNTTDVSRITPETFWDSGNHINKYQFIVYFGCTSFSAEPPLRSTIRNAVAGAIANGTNAIFVGAGVYNWMNLFGLSLSGTGDCPPDPQAGGRHCFTPGHSLEFGIRSSFCGITSGDTCWVKGKVYDANNSADWPSGNAVPDVKMPTLSWNGTHGAEFMNATANSSVFPNVIYRNYGSNHAQIWWFGATEGVFSDYLEGWAGTFDNQEYSPGCSPASIPATTYYGCSYYQGFAPEVQLFYYDLKNVTNKATPIMMPWSTDGSAEIIRDEDHSSICPTFTSCATAAGNPNVGGLTTRGVVGEMNVNLNGWSNSVPLPLSPGLPPGATNSPCTAGYQYYGQLTTTWNSRYFLTCAKVNNMTATTDGGTGNTGTHTSKVVMNDGNTTAITNIEVLITATSTPSWTASLSDSTGATVWTSSAQTTTLSSPTWVKFSNINFTGGLSGYVNNLQGADKLTVTVSSGTVTWENQSSTQANWVITGRGAWDIVYIDPTAGTKNFATAKAIMPDSIRMASGSLYPRANTTFYITGVPGLVQPADIAGDGNTGGPTAANIQTFFNATDWSLYGATQVANWRALVALGWQVVTNGFTHAKTAAGSTDNDFVYGNGTTMGAPEITKRVTDIKVMLDNVIGSAYVSSSWAFGTSAGSYYPGEAQMVSGGFTEAQLATDNMGVQSFITAGFYQSASSGGGSLYGIEQGDKVSSGVSWTSAYNESRDMQGIIDTHSDATAPWSDYVQAGLIKATQQYDENSTWFTTSQDALNFWNTTLYAMQHTKAFIWNPSTGQITLTFYTGTSKYIDQTNFNNPIVFRLPESFNSRGFTSGGDNQTSGSITNSTANWRYYQVNVGHKWTAFTFTYSEPTTTLTVNTQPTNLSNAFKFDYTTFSSPHTFSVYINSVHAVSALSPIGCGSLCVWGWSSWSDSGVQSHGYTVPGTAPTLSATYAQTSLVPRGVMSFVPITVNNTSGVNWIRGTQWPVLIDWNAYASRVDSTLRNVVFFDSSGNVWNTWNENGTSSSAKGLVWLKSQVPLASHASYVVNLGFYPTSTNNYSPTGNWGEAPQLSSTYGQYDNGAKVFEQYVNFAGSSCPSSQGNWVCGAGSAVSNGLVLADQSASYAYSTTKYSGNATQILDMQADFPTPTSDNPTFAGYANNVNINSGPYAYGFAERASSYSATGPVGFWAKTGAGVGRTTAFSPGNAVYTVYAPNGTYSFQENYGAALTLSNGAADSPQSIGANNGWSSGGQTLTITWMRLRVDGGQFVSTRFGSVMTVYTLTTSAGTGGTVLPSTEGWGSGSLVYVEAVPSGGYAFNAWACAGSGCVGGSSNPISVTMNNEISETASFNSLALGVTLPLEVCLQEPGAASATFGLSGAGVSQTTITGAYSCSAVNLSVSPSSTVIVTVPADGANSRYRMNGSSTSPLTEAVPTCASGTCATVKIDSYYQLNNTYGAAPVNPTAWDFSGSLAVKGTIAGSPGQTGCSISTTSGHGAVGCASYFDYDTTVSITSPIVVSSTERWVQSCGSSGDEFAATSGGNSYGCNYGRQWQVQFAVSPNSSYGSVSPSSTAFYNDGTNGTTLAVVATANVGHTFSTWSASSGSIIFASPSSPSTTAVIEAAGTIDANFVGSESGSTVTLTCTMSNGAPADTVALSESSGNGPSPASALCDGLPHTITTDASATLTATVGSCSSSCEYRFNPSGTLVTTLSIQAPSAGGSRSWSFHDYMILGNTYAADANAQTDFDTSMSCALTGTVGGNSSSSNSISSTAATSDSSTVYFDYNTPVSFCATFSSAPAHSQWARTGAYQFTETTGGNTLTVQYWKQWTNDFMYSVTGGGSPTAPTLVCNELGAPATLTLTNSGQAFYCDNSAGASATNPTTGSNSAERWSDNGQSFTIISGGNAETFVYYHQLKNTYQATPINPASWDAALSIAVTGAQFGSNGQTGCTIATAIGGGAAACAAWFDYNTQATIGSPANVSANERWAQACGSGGNQYTQTTGGNLDNCNFVMELQNTYACNPSVPSTFDGAYACTATGTLAGVASSIICTANTVNSGGSVNCSGYSDYGDAVSLPSSLGSWTVSGTRSWTDTTGGNTRTANYSEMSLTSPVIMVSPTTIDSGQSSTISTTSSFGGGTSPYTCQWLVEAPGGLSYALLGASFSCTTTSLPTTSTGTLSATGTWSFELQVTDSASKTVTSNAVTVAVNSALSGVALGSFITNPVSPGQSDSIPVSWSGGTSTYTVTLYYSTSSSSCSSTNTQAAQSTGVSSSTITMTFTAPSPAGTYYYCALVKDSLGGSASSSVSGTSLIVTVAALGPPTISVSPAIIDSGQPSTLSTVTPFSGGTSPYTCQWLKEAPGGSYTNLGSAFASGCTSSSLPTISTGALSATGTWHFELKVTDSASKTVTSNAVSVTVNTALAAPKVSSSPTTVDLGQSSSLTSTAVTTGTPSYAYQWLAQAPGATSYSAISGATSASFIFATSASTATGTWHFELKVTDSASKTVTSNAVSVTVNTALAAPVVSSSRATINRGGSSSLTSTKVTTGTSSYKYQWLVEAPGATSYSAISGATSASFTFATSASTATGTWHFELVVTDSTGAVVTSNAVSVTVNP